MSDESQMLEPVRFPLWGSRLIEASAGTGKTYTIAALFVRLILGHGQQQGQDNGPVRALGPKEILVMTFTKAATQELSTRIQQRLTQTAQVFRGQIKLDPRDQFLKELLDDYPTQSEKDNAAWLLGEAAQCMDESCIYTIDAWCQRVLKEYAVYSGQPFDEELVSNQAPLRQQAIEDFWRQSVYPLSPEHAKRVKNIWPKEIEDLERWINDNAFDLENSIDVDGKEEGEGESTPTVFDLNAYWTTMLSERALKLKALKRDAKSCMESIRPWLESLSNQPAQQWNLRSLVKHHLFNWLDEIEAWCKDDSRLDIDLDAQHWKRITFDAIKKSWLDQSTDFMHPKELHDFERIGGDVFSMKTIKEDFEGHCLKAIKNKIKLIKQQNSTFGFTDLLTRLDAKLHQSNGIFLKELIKKQYPAILIDEFQDTSSLQYSIFNTLYEIDQNDRNHLICLIADPKQSIYAFRGADINSYMRAKASSSPRHYYLGQNYRSTAALVQVVNRWFSFAQARAPWGAFLYKMGDRDDLPFHPVQANGLAPWIVQTKERGGLGEARMPSLSMVCDLTPSNAQTVQKKFAALCAEKIVSWLNDEGMSYTRGSEDAGDQKTQRIEPADIAVLVRTTKESIAVRHALSLRGVASVFLSDQDSVFKTNEARDLMFWLDAVANPRLADKVRAGLATSTMGLDFEEIKSIGCDDGVYDFYSEMVSDLHQVWVRVGVLAMLRSTLYLLSLPQRWLKNPEGERRLTNYLHLSELLQAASLVHVGLQSLQKWLALAIEDQGLQTDEHILRLESDADLVKVITIHKSKGLEFPLVCLPFPTLFNNQARKKVRVNPFVEPPLSSQVTMDEELRESMRLFYVALTRAKYALWLGFSLFKDGRTGKDLTHRSALGYLLGSTATDLKPEEWKTKIDLFFKEASLTGDEEVVFLPLPVEDPDPDQRSTRAQGHACEGGFDTTNDPSVYPNSIDGGVQVNSLRVHRSTTPLRPNSPYTAQFERHFKIQSFSSLLRNTVHASIVTDILGGGVVNDDESMDWETGNETAELSAKRLLPPHPNASLKPKALERAGVPWRDMPGGMKVGTFIHDTLQWMIQEGLDALESTAYQKKLRQKIETTLPLDLSLAQALDAQGMESEPEWDLKTKLVEDFVAWFEAIVSLPLQTLGVNLKDISRHLCEMEFWLPVETFHASRIERVCRQFIFPSLERQTHLTQNWQGLLMGFADLIFEHDGRFWLIDYKSNDLGLEEDAYSVENIQRHVVKHRYDLQMAIYLVALHRVLKSRLGSRYVVSEHLGGAILWYLRGIDSPSQGVCSIPASSEMIEALDGSILGSERVQKFSNEKSKTTAFTTHE